MNMYLNYCSVIAVFLQVRFSYGTNVLFITIDDLRPDLGCYAGSDFPSSNDSPIYSPNIDDLARKSFLLKRAYVQEALCAPSRTSFLTGRRPGTTKVYDLVTYFRYSGGNFTTIPQYFKENGYVSLGYGKIFHAGSVSGYDDPLSWSEPFVRPNESKWEEKDRAWRSVTQNQTDQDPLVDMKIAKHAIHALRQFSKGGKYENKSFFLAVGFRRPHLPFVFPSQFQDHYPLGEIKLPKNPYAPYHMPNVAWSNSSELQQYADLRPLAFQGSINESLPNDVILNLRRAYFSTITFVDSLVGDVLDEVKRLGFENNTVISLLGDHGWHLGEHGIWGKETNFEVGTHAPLMIHVPGLTDAGIVSTKITEFVDIFPSLVDAVGLPSLPICPEDSSSILVCTEGESLVPLMQNPNLDWKNAAFSQYPRDRHNLDVMGYSIRTDSYRYTEWLKFNNATSRGEWTRLVGTELYNHAVDPDENTNLANEVLRVKHRDGEIDSIEQIYSNDGREISGSSIATYADGKLVVGSVAKHAVVYMSP